MKCPETARQVNRMHTCNEEKKKKNYLGDQWNESRRTQLKSFYKYICLLLFLLNIARGVQPDSLFIYTCTIYMYIYLCTVCMCCIYKYRYIGYEAEVGMHARAFGMSGESRLSRSQHGTAFSSSSSFFQATPTLFYPFGAYFFNATSICYVYIYTHISTHINTTNLNVVFP